MFAAERLGELPSNYRINWRSTALNYELGPRGLEWGNITGGWMGGGLSGTVKNTIPIASTVSMLAWSVLEFGEVGFSTETQSNYTSPTGLQLWLQVVHSTGCPLPKGRNLPSWCGPALSS